MSEKPVDIFEQTPETDNILKNLGNFPIHIRQAQKWSTSKEDLPENPDISTLSNLELAVINKDDLKIKPVRI